MRKQFIYLKEEKIMIKSLKKFWKDYVVAYKAGIDFYKNHWFGSIIFVIVYTILAFIAAVIAEIFFRRCREEDEDDDNDKCCCKWTFCNCRERQRDRDRERNNTITLSNQDIRRIAEQLARIQNDNNHNNNCCCNHSNDVATVNVTNNTTGGRTTWCCHRR